MIFAPKFRNELVAYGSSFIPKFRNTSLTNLHEIMNYFILRVGKPEDLQSVVETLEKMYNEVVDKYNAVMDSNIRLNLELVKLQDEKAELKHQLDVLIKGR